MHTQLFDQLIFEPLEELQREQLGSGNGTVSCGDWSMIPNIEGAVVSGIDAGEKLADALISRNKL